MIYTSYFNNKRKGEGIKLAICRYYPKWLLQDEYIHVPQLSPSDSLRIAYKTGEINFRTFIERFNAEMTQEELGHLATYINQSQEEGKDLYLCCHEADLDNCHRYYFNKLLNSINVKCEEF